LPKFVLIGAGSAQFSTRFVADILAYPELDGSTIVLVDPNADRLSTLQSFCLNLVRERGSSVSIEAHADRTGVLDGAHYVLTTIHVGSDDAWQTDIDIARDYGVDQSVGDTIGPGGVFRGLRNAPVLLDLVHEMELQCPNAVLLQYTNPMSIICLAISRQSSIVNLGLCHSVQNTARQLAGYLGMELDELDYWTAGINHMAWVLKLQRRGVDLYPRLREAAADPDTHALDPVRFDIMRWFGYFVTESSKHMSEYVPFFRKDAERVQREEFYPFPGDEIRARSRQVFERLDEHARGETPFEVSRSHEFAMQIVNSLEGRGSCRINANVPNHGLIANLPDGCCVEVPCQVDSLGVHPHRIGRLPDQLAALNRTNVNVHEMAVNGLLSGSRDPIYQALMLDPLTAAVVDPDDIVAMADQLFEAHRGRIPPAFYPS
jgi:alpha-galactosidase